MSLLASGLMPEPSPASETLAKIGLPDTTSRIAVGVVVFAVIAAVLTIDQASGALAAGKAFVVFHFDAVFVATANLALVFLLVLALHPSSSQRLGKDTDRPEFSRPAWFAMLFSAGLASGILYWGTAEPLIHFQSNPLSPPDAAWADRVRVALRITMVHWGLHGWAFYVIVALALALPSYREGRPLVFRTALFPLLGEAWIDRWPGRLIDLLAVFGTICGVATSIGLSATSMNATLASLGGFEISTTNQVGIIIVVCLLGIVSALSGVARGIRWLSSLNAWVSFGLMLAFLFLGPTLPILALTVSGFADYVVQVIPVGLWLGETQAEQTWQGDWTVFYWAWWLAWTPFVSLFIARISKGRTVREFAIAVSLVPTAATLVWMGVFGGTALLQEQAMPGAISTAVNADYALGLVAVIETLGGSGIQTVLVAVATFLLFTWLITSLDSATLVMCHMLGVEEVPAAKIFWGIAFAAVSAILLIAGGLAALQAASIVMGLPLAFVVILVLLGMIKELVRGRA